MNPNIGYKGIMEWQAPHTRKNLTRFIFNSNLLKFIVRARNVIKLNSKTRPADINFINKNMTELIDKYSGFTNKKNVTIPKLISIPKKANTLIFLR